jgi:EAL domain-containing protein (putative c-di-GMP-specific phosphodiesterase class I)/ActR/RegA family two-component response regulator
MSIVTNAAQVQSGLPLAYVLDDEPQIAAIVGSALGTAGYDARLFSAPMPFFVEIKKATPEVIVLDLALGQTDAVEVIRRLEVLKFTGKVLLISGRDEVMLAEVQEIGRSHGLAMLPSLKKPFRVNELKERLKAATEMREPAPAAERSKTFTVDFSEAMENKWLELWYQPKVSLKSLKVCGAEALLRARHPTHGIVSPANLLPPPGDSRYQELSRFVVQRAMADWDTLADQDIFMKFAVNVPVSVISAPGFMRTVRELLPLDRKFTGLIVEVTEDDIIKDPELIREIATQLKIYNVQISIDDFGSAYSSLSRLLELPCVELKLDRSFVANCSIDPQKQTLCRTVINLAHQFNASVCAEGVETANDLRALIAMGCDMAQGFLFAKPMTLDAFARTLTTQPTQPAKPVSETTSAGTTLAALRS